MGHGDAFTAADWLVGVKMDRLNFSETDENSRHFSIALFTILLFFRVWRYFASILVTLLAMSTIARKKRGSAHLGNNACLIQNMTQGLARPAEVPGQGAPNLPGPPATQP